MGLFTYLTPRTPNASDLSRYVIVRSLWLGGCSLIVSSPASAITTDLQALAEVRRFHGAAIEHCDEAVEEGFVEAFECGDELFEVVFNSVDGVGSNVGDGGRFTRTPRADLDGPGEWARHTPTRATGPNAASCVACHQGTELGGAGDGSGFEALNVIRDPLHTADPGQFIQRNTPHLFGPGALQRLAEEMTVELRARREAGVAKACEQGGALEVQLTSKGVEYGHLTVDCSGVLDTSGIDGVDEDLIVRPFQWKGSDHSVRSFSRGAELNELGLQPVELTGDGIDGDGDGVRDEITIADMTAMAVYLAAQPRPVSQLELNRLRIAYAFAGQFDRIAEHDLPMLSRNEIESIRRGEDLFGEIGCADCHRPALLLEDPVFTEPSTVEGYRDDPFPAGQPALRDALFFDLTEDLPDNQFTINGRRFDLGNFERVRENRGRRRSGAMVRLYGDLKRREHR
jgi:hypothetical protein